MSSTFRLFFAQRLQLAAAVVDNADGGCESKFEGALADDQRILRMVNAAAHHGIDVHMKIRVLGEQLEFLVEDFQALLGDFVRHHVVDGDLQVFQAGAVQPLYPLRGQEVAIGDDGGDGSVTADGADDFVEVGVEERFSAADGDDAGAHPGQEFNEIGRASCRERVSSPV